MVNQDPDEKQRTFTDYEQTQSDASINCPVCGIERENERVAKQCCRSDQLDLDRAGVVTSPDDPHVGFAVLPHVSDEWTELIHRARDAIAAAETNNPLPAAIRVLQDCLVTETGEAELKQIFAHLVFLQEIQVLPGYPVKARTGNSDLPTIREYCNDREDLSGHISKSSVRESEVVAADSLARFTPLTTHKTFTPGAGTNTPFYEWDTTIQLIDSIREFETNLVVNQGTAHNAMAIEARDQLIRHSNIDMVTAPYRIKTGTFELEATTDVHSRTERHEANPPIQPTYTFDFAGFSNEPSPKLEILGLVVDDYEIHDLARLAVSTKTDAARLIVAPTRNELQQFIADLLRDLSVDDIPAPDEAVEYYNKQPSLNDAVKTIKRDIGFSSPIAFTTFQKLRDGSRTPIDILDETLLGGED